MGNTTRYSLSRCTLEVDGYTLSGFGVNGGVKLVVPEIATVDHGADGDHSFNVAKPDYMDVEITLLPGAVGNKHLDAINGAQIQEDTLTDRAFNFYDPGNGDRVDAKNFMILQAPDFDLGKANGERVWKCCITGISARRAANISG